MSRSGGRCHPERLVCSYYRIFVMAPRLVILQLVSVIALAVVLAGCAGGGGVGDGQVPRPEHVRAYYRDGLNLFDSALVRLANLLAEPGVRAADHDSVDMRVRTAFAAARVAYKRVEFLVEHYTPSTAATINGPPVSEVEEDDPNQYPILPEGLQVIEAGLFGEQPVPTREVRDEIATVRSAVRRLRSYLPTLPLDDAHLFAAMREQMVRIIALGLSGFDVAYTGTSVQEAAAALESLQRTYALYATALRERDAAAAGRLDSLFAGARQALRPTTTFDVFDRLTFIRAYADPLFGALGHARRVLGIPAPHDRRALGADATTLFATESFDPYFFAPAYAVRGSAEAVQLGRLLFFDPVLSGNQQRSCASCHQPEKAFADGRERSVAFGRDGMVARNAPTLLNAALQSGYFYDRRVMYLEDQAAAVVANTNEMHGSLAQAVARLRGSQEYRARFARAFGMPDSAAITEQHIRRAIADYVRSLARLNSAFDQYMRGDDNAMGVEARRGFNLFMGRARCGTCHFAPLFNGALPPAYAETETEILGVPAAYDTVRPRLDADPGRYDVHRIELERFAFKTPTLRNVALTAPYMHNGAFGSLADVLDFYDRGGGAGLGIGPPTQTLPTSRLNLSAGDRADLLAFLSALTDTSGTANRPAALPMLGERGVRRNVGGLY